MSDDVLLELVGDDPAENERLALALRDELLEIDEVEDVSQATAGPAPDGARGLDVAAVGALLVTVEPTIELLGKVFRVVQGWLSRGHQPGQVLKVTINGQSIEFTATSKQQDAVVKQYLKSVAKA
jgi:hypothetical protein